MGGSQETPSDPSQFGFRIYKLIKDGPLEKGGAKEITDFIIPPFEVLSKQNPFNDWILSLADKTITIKLYSLMYRGFKYIEIKTNPFGSKEGILGASVKYENFETADKNLLHITSVAENSFAKNKLGLIPNDDYIIAAKTINSTITSLNTKGYNPLEILNIIINNYTGKDITFFIYNAKSGSRVIDSKLEKEEDDEDKLILGCDVAYGALHEFPRIVNDNNSEELTDHNENNNKGKKIKEKIGTNIINNNGEQINENNQNIEKDDNDNKIMIVNEENKDKDVIEEDII